LTTFTLFGQAAPSGSAPVDAGNYTMGVQWSSSVPGTVTAVWWYSPAGAPELPTQVALYQVSGGGTGTLVHSEAASWSGAAGSGWVRSPFASPPAISASTAYKAAILRPGTANVAWYQHTADYWDTGAGSGGVVSGPLTAPNNAGGDAGQDTFTAGATLAYPATSFQASNYWVDVELTTGTARTRTASLTVTPSFTASRAAGRFRTASLTVAPSFSAARTRAAHRTASLAVAPAFAVTRAQGHARTASLTVPFAFRAVPSGGHAKLERQLVRLAVAAYFGGAKVTADAGTCFQGGPLTAFGLGTAYPYTVRNVPDEYYTAGMPAGQNWGAVMYTTRVERNTKLDSYGGAVSGWWARRYTIECEIALICELPHIEVAGAALDDLIDKVHALIYADRTLGTNGGASGLQILQAGAGRAGIRDVTGKFAALDEVKGRYAAEATVTFEALTMVTA
jgi:hypothetical protein